MNVRPSVPSVLQRTAYPVLSGTEQRLWTGSAAPVWCLRQTFTQRNERMSSCIDVSPNGLWGRVGLSVLTQYKYFCP